MPFPSGPEAVTVHLAVSVEYRRPGVTVLPPVPLVEAQLPADVGPTEQSLKLKPFHVAPVMVTGLTPVNVNLVSGNSVIKRLTVGVIGP